MRHMESKTKPLLCQKLVAYSKRKIVGVLPEVSFILNEITLCRDEYVQ